VGTVVVHFLDVARKARAGFAMLVFIAAAPIIVTAQQTIGGVNHFVAKPLSTSQMK
jgi:hypothetical protein